MVRNYVGKSTTAWSEKDLKNAFKAIRQGLSMRKASAQFKIPLGTLSIRYQAGNFTIQKLGSFKPFFDVHQEAILNTHIVEMQQKFNGLTPEDLKKLAYSVAEMMKIDHPFNKEQKKAGDDWYYDFLKRNPNLSLRKPEKTSIARIKGFNKEAINQFYDVLLDAYREFDFEPRSVYNIDETGINVVHNPGKILAKKGTKQVGKVVSGERGKNVTVCCAMSASGNFVPPFFVFYHAKMNHIFMRGKFPGSVGVANGIGWMDSPTFLLYLDHFIKHAKPTKEDPILVVLDGHSSHKSLEVITKCRENFITLITLPPHTSHRTQPLDRTFFGPLKTEYSKQSSKLLPKEKNQAITIYDIVKLFSDSFAEVAKIPSAVNGFACTGIWPFDRNIFEESEFYREETTMENNSPGSPESLLTEQGQDVFIPSTIPSCTEQESEFYNSPDSPEPLLPEQDVIPSTSSTEQDRIEDLENIDPSSINKSMETTVPTDPPPTEDGKPVNEDISFGTAIKRCSPSSKMEPLVTPKKAKRAGRRNKEISTRLTGSPYKNMLAKKNEQKTKKESNVKKGKRGHPKSKRENNIEPKPSTSKGRTSDAECIYCCDRFSNSKNREKWVQCSQCNGWAHEKCGGGTDICDLCLLD